MLSSSADGGLTATYVPEAGMVCCSLRHRGDELLGQRGGIDRYIAEHGTMGIPLLHPWANRLAERQFSLGGTNVDVDLAGDCAAVDRTTGLPIHGLLSGHPGWRASPGAPSDEGVCLGASFDFSTDPRLIAAFPFPHTLRMEVNLRGTRLEITTTLSASGPVPVPVSFGYHPYFTLPGAARPSWQLELPARRPLLLDQQMIPTGESAPVAPAEAAPLGARTFDDPYGLEAAGERFVLAGGGRRIVVRFEEGFPQSQVYAPDDDDVVALEPMTAPTNALVSGQDLIWVAPGAEHRTRFSVQVSSS
jgi:galactose mutarotase-like enzyme